MKNELTVANIAENMSCGPESPVYPTRKDALDALVLSASCKRIPIQDIPIVSGPPALRNGVFRKPEWYCLEIWMQGKRTHVVSYEMYKYSSLNPAVLFYSMLKPLMDTPRKVVLVGQTLYPWTGRLI